MLSARLARNETFKGGIMIKRILTCAAAAVAAFAMASPAVSEDGPAFVIYFYDDALHSNQVGFARARCYPGPHAELWWGYVTDYRVEEFVGECIDGVLYPY